MLWPRSPYPLAVVVPLKGCSRLSRKEARLFTSIWNDEDFTALPPDAQWLYFFLLSQPDLSYCGVLPLRPGRWVRKANGLTVDGLRAGLAVLAGTGKPFVVVDEEMGEVLIRSLIRRDGVWKSPNIMKAARESAEAVESPAIRAALLAELERIPGAEAESKLVREAHAEFVADLRRQPGNPSPNPSGMSHQDYAGTSSYPQGGRQGAAPRGETAEPKSPQVRELRNPSGNPSRKGPGGKSPFPPSPVPSSPLPLPGEPARLSEFLPAATGAPGGGGKIPDERTPRAVAALIAETLAIRDDWDDPTVRRALDHENVTRRPWPRVVAAMLCIARDPKTEHPNRLGQAGPWWRAPLPKTARPPWCRKCDETTRMREADNGARAVHCPECHPAAAGSRRSA